jgi:hypothetical protein
VGEVVKGMWMVLATALTLACLTLACSAVLRRTQAATVVAYGVTLALVLGTLIVYGAQQIPRANGTPRPRPWILALNPFAATADVVQGRNESSTFESPFSALGDLLRLSDEDRFSQILAGSAEESIEIRPNGQVINRGGGGPGVQIAPAPPMTAVGRVAPPPPMPPGAFIDAGPGAAFGQFGPIEQLDADRRVKLAGVPFWVVSLFLWLVLAIAAVALTVRRISLPANRES